MKSVEIKEYACTYHLKFWSITGSIPVTVRDWAVSSVWLIYLFEGADEIILPDDIFMERKLRLMANLWIRMGWKNLMTRRCLCFWCVLFWCNCQLTTKALNHIMNPIFIIRMRIIGFRMYKKKLSINEQIEDLISKKRQIWVV